MMKKTNKKTSTKKTKSNDTVVKQKKKKKIKKILKLLLNILTKESPTWFDGNVSKKPRLTVNLSLNLLITYNICKAKCQAK